MSEHTLDDLAARLAALAVTETRVPDALYPDDTWVTVTTNLLESPGLVRLEFADKPSATLASIEVSRSELVAALAIGESHGY